MTVARLALVAALLAAAIEAPTAAAAEPVERLTVVNLRVLGGADAWHPVNSFRLDWDRVPNGPRAAAVHYLVWDESGVVVPETRIAPEVTEIEDVHVPDAPGTYLVDVWLEGRRGEMGRPATASLRFDDVPPGPARPAGPDGWIGAGTPALIRIEHPAMPLPVSGVRGYAISLDRGEGSMPCLGAVGCAPGEIDLSRGIADDTASLGVLPEGVSFVRAVAVSGSGVRSRSVESEMLRVDATLPEMRLRGLPSGWSNRPVRLTATAADALSGMAEAGPGGPFTAIVVDGQIPIAAGGDSVSATVAGEGTHRIEYYARDAAGNVADGEAGAPAPPSALLGIDETPPRIAFAPHQDPSDPERIEATVTDALSGWDPSRGTIAVRRAGSRQSFEPLPTTAERGRLVARWDSARYPPGVYELTATGYDAAGNPSSGDRRLGGAPMVLANPLKEPTELLSGFGGRRLAWLRCSRRVGSRRCHRETTEAFERRPRARAVPYGRGATFSGRLRDASGAALGGLPVLVTETFAAGAEPGLRTTIARTGEDGRFQVHLPPGPSRRVEATFAGNPVLYGSQAPPSRLEALSSVRLRASAATARIGGAPVVFSGGIGRLGSRIPTEGVSVELQFRLAGSAWTVFRTLRTDATGRFRYPYVFSDDDSRDVRFQFRAHLPPQTAWPYEPAASLPVTVTGR